LWTIDEFLFEEILSINFTGIVIKRALATAVVVKFLMMWISKYPFVEC
jgi:hypothetical protein